MKALAHPAAQKRIEVQIGYRAFFTGEVAI
jgi:hypothetical protein